jgi:hypothetical protein
MIDPRHLSYRGFLHYLIAVLQFCQDMLMRDEIMMQRPTDTATREQRPVGDMCDATLWMPDEELSDALRAAGASAEDVQCYLASQTTCSTENG